MERYEVNLVKLHYVGSSELAALWEITGQDHVKKAVFAPDPRWCQGLSSSRSAVLWEKCVFTSGEKLRGRA